VEDRLRETEGFSDITQECKVLFPSSFCHWLLPQLLDAVKEYVLTDTEFRRQHISLSHPWSWTYVRYAKMELSECVGQMHILPASTKADGEAGWALSTGRWALLQFASVHGNQSCKGHLFWWERWSSFMQRCAYVFKSNLILQLFWQRV